MTLMELLDVLVILGVLLSVAVPSYLGLRDRTNQSAAKANLRNIVPTVIEYAADNGASYAGLSASTLQSRYDPTLDATKIWAVPMSGGTSYCVYTWVGPWTAYQFGPSAPIAVTASTSFNSGTCAPS
jgi:Tfp pilus assembly protein PilE